MAKFKFRLATLLRIREAARDRRRAELAEAYRVEDLLRANLEHLGKEIDWLRGQCRKIAGPGTVNVDRLVDSQRYELVLRSQKNELNTQRAAVGEEIERRRQTLLAADREVRVLEKLRDKQADRHRRWENRLEIKQVDEVARQRAIREDYQ